MTTAIFNMIIQVFQNVVGWFDTVMQQTESLSTWLVGVLMIIVLRLIIQPFVGHAVRLSGSDRASKRDRQGGDK